MEIYSKVFCFAVSIFGYFREVMKKLNLCKNFLIYSTFSIQYSLVIMASQPAN